MSTHDDLRMEREVGGFANFYCERCNEQVGRVQLEPPQDEPDWDARVRGEIEVLAAEHRDLCSARG